jgi:signal transduction histidine kinase/CheY-like chemotaxis protein
VRILRDLGIARKLTIINTLTSGVALVLTCAAIMIFELIVVRESMISDLSTTATIIGDNSAAALTFGDSASAEQTLRSLNAHAHIVAAVLYDKDREVFASYRRSGSTPRATVPAHQAGGHRFMAEGLELFRSFEIAGERAGTVYIRCDLTVLKSRMQRYALIVGVVLVMACAVAMLLSAALQTAISAPIAHLAQVAHRVSTENNYALRAHKHSNDELGRLIDGFNAMLLQIQVQDSALQEARSTLEKRVEERTRELQKEISDREQAQAELVQANAGLLRANQRAQALADRALDASRAKSAFLANMSHEIRTPMNGVLGVAQLLLDEPLSTAQRDYAQTIHDSGRALLAVLNDILDFSKIEAGKLDLELAPVDLRQLLVGLERLITVQTAAKALRFELKIGQQVPEWIVGDSARLRQVLMNLCGNAVKFTAAGQVVLSVELLSRGAQNVQLRFEVCDTGVGIPADRVAGLFQPFAQGDNSVTRRFGGTGLGLSIVRRLVDLMGGEVGLQTREGVGSTFWVTTSFELPQTGAMAEVALPEQARSSITGRTPRILLAEDNAVNCLVATRMLERLGYAVETVSDGRQAVEAWRCGGHDLILMDCQMPELDGYQAAREIRSSEPPGRHIPIVALTAHAMKDDGAKCIAAGMDAHLTKPVVRQALQECLQQLLRAGSEDAPLRLQPVGLGVRQA